jgi:hypothetical protein
MQRLQFGIPVPDRERSAQGRVPRPSGLSWLVPMVALSLLLSACASGSGGTTQGETAAASRGRGPTPAPSGLPTGCAPYQRTELFFGTSRTVGPPVSDQEFSAFLDAEITPRFPDGLTLISGLGQYRGADGKLTKERSMQLILLYPKSSAVDSGAKIEEIRQLYEQKFHQESVLRADDPEPRCVSF